MKIIVREDLCFIILSSHVALPREGHLEATVHAIAHVGQRYNSRLMYDPSYLEMMF